MKASIPFATAIVTALLISAPGYAATGVSDMAKICKAGALDHYAQLQPTRVKFKGVSGPRLAKQVRLQIFPQGDEAFDATCELNTKTGEILALSRQS